MFVVRTELNHPTRIAEVNSHSATVFLVLVLLSIMKSFIKNSAFSPKFAALAIAFSLFLGMNSGVQAQHIGSANPISSPYYYYHFQPSGAVEQAPKLSAKQITQIRNRASRTVFLTSKQIGQLHIESILTKVETQTAAVQEGANWSFSNFTGTGSDEKLHAAQAVVVSLNYEARPSGGILQARVELRPAFSGVGVSNRPYVSEGVSQVIEEVNPAAIRSIVASLTSLVVAKASASLASIN